MICFLDKGQTVQPCTLVRPYARMLLMMSFITSCLHTAAVPTKLFAPDSDCTSRAAPAIIAGLFVVVDSDCTSQLQPLFHIAFHSYGPSFAFVVVTTCFTRLGVNGR